MRERALSSDELTRTARIADAPRAHPCSAHLSCVHVRWLARTVAATRCEHRPITTVIKFLLISSGDSRPSDGSLVASADAGRLCLPARRLPTAMVGRAHARSSSGQCLRRSARVLITLKTRETKSTNRC